MSKDTVLTTQYEQGYCFNYTIWPGYCLTTEYEQAVNLHNMFVSC